MLLLAGCASEPQPAPRGIVSLNPCTDAVLAEVADPGQIRALSRYSSDPASSSMPVAVARRFPAVSGTVEEIVALRPALVVAGTFTPPATRAALARLGVPLVELPIATSVADSLAQVRQLAALAGHPARGEALNARIGAALAAAAAPAGPPVPALVWQSGGIVPGERTLIADLLRRTGFSNAAAARGLGQADFLPLERVLADPPRVILAAGDGSGEDRLLAHPALAGLKATRRFAFAPSLLWCGGPTIIRAAARLGEVRAGLPDAWHGQKTASVNSPSPPRRRGPIPTWPDPATSASAGEAGMGPRLRGGDGRLDGKHSPHPLNLSLSKATPGARPVG